MKKTSEALGDHAHATNRKLPVAGVVLTYNEALNISACLDSVKDWCEEIYVVDSGSTDDTVRICERYAAQIYRHSFVDSASQWNWAFDNLPIKSPWVFVLDADHRVSAQLWEEIREALSSATVKATGYYSRHQYFFWGQRIRGFKPYGLRLFRTGHGRADPSELVDMRFQIDGDIDTLSGFVYEQNAKEDSIDFWIDKHQRFAVRMAIEQILRNSDRLRWDVAPTLFGNQDQQMVWLKNRWYRMPLFVRPCAYFVYRYVIRLGFLDGRRGLLFHFLHAFWFRLLVDLHVKSLQREVATGRLSLDELAAMGRPSELKSA